jgi:hypothetical protein
VDSADSVSAEMFVKDMQHNNEKRSYSPTHIFRTNEIDVFC